MEFSLKTNQPRIIVLRLDNIGDVVMLTPALRALRKAYPAAQVTVMVSPAGSQVLDLIPWVDKRVVSRVLWQDASGSMEFDPNREMKLIKTLEHDQYDAAFIFTSFSQSAFPPGYVCYLAGIPVRAGFGKEFGGGVLSHQVKPPMDEAHQVDRNLALLASLGIALDGQQMELHIPSEIAGEVDRILAEVGLSKRESFIVAAPGASCTARRYPAPRFAEAIDLLSSEIDFPILLLGSSKDEMLLEEFERVLQPARIISLIGRTTLAQAADLIRRARLVITNNSASLHIADAFQVPQVVLYSGTEYLTQWQPRFSQAAILRQETSCSPCYRFECPFHLECLDIDPREVVAAAVKHLEEASEIKIAAD